VKKNNPFEFGIRTETGEYIFDMRFSDPWPNDILKLWKSSPSTPRFTRWVLPERILRFGRRFVILRGFSRSTETTF
jgi:hypothetical protein